MTNLVYAVIIAITWYVGIFPAFASETIEILPATGAGGAVSVVAWVSAMTVIIRWFMGHVEKLTVAHAQAIIEKDTLLMKLVDDCRKEREIYEREISETLREVREALSHIAQNPHFPHL